MINTQSFGNKLKALNYDFYSGVPCSFLTPLINYAINECSFIMASNEGDAVSICAGANLGKRKSVVFMQNSGLTNAVSPITSLLYTFQIPILGFVSLRGEEHLNDEPQHELMGKITPELLSLQNVEWDFLATTDEEIDAQLKKADDCINQNKSFFFIVKKGTFSKTELKNIQTSSSICNHFSPKQSQKNCVPTSRLESLDIITREASDDTIFLATTGKTGRELYELKDSPNNLYMVGSMGCISSLGLGLAISQPNKKIIVIDGDGSLIMRLGNLCTNGFYSPPNLLHMLLDNNVHDSTGAQFTVASNINFLDIAKGCHYTNVVYAHDSNELDKEILKWKKEQGLTLIYKRILKGSKPNLGRPKIKPFEVKERLKAFIHAH